MADLMGTDDWYSFLPVCSVVGWVSEAEIVDVGGLVFGVSWFLPKGRSSFSWCTSSTNKTLDRDGSPVVDFPWTCWLFNSFSSSLRCWLESSSCSWSFGGTSLKIIQLWYILRCDDWLILNRECPLDLWSRSNKHGIDRKNPVGKIQRTSKYHRENNPVRSAVHYTIVVVWSIQHWNGRTATMFICPAVHRLNSSSLHSRPNSDFFI